MKTVTITDSGRIRDDDGQRIGEILAEGNTIKKIEIDPPYQGEGYGKAAVKHFCNNASENGYSTAYIACITNQKLVGIAKSFGGSEVSSHSLPIAPHPMLERDKPDYEIPLPLD